ncbi:MAG: hypothetical protein WBR13_16015 [Allosphingosinicella sp.]
MSMAGIFMALIAAADFAQMPAAAPPPPAEDIVVTGTRGSVVRKVRPDAIEVLRGHCFEPLRLTRRFEEPSVGPRWIELDDTERRQFDIESPDVPAYAMEDESRAQHLWLKFERLELKGNIEEQRCTLLVIGGRDHRRFVDDMSGLFRGGPTQRHVGREDGSPVLADWEQWLWTGRPSRGSKSWNRVKPRRGSLPTWTVVLDVQGFYNSYDYIMGDMKSRRGAGTAVTMLTFSLTTRPRRQSASKPPPVAAASLSSAAVQPPR